MPANISDRNLSANPEADLDRIIPVSILLVCIDLITVFGNILVIMAVLKTRSIRNITCNYYIVSLAVSDLLLGILVLPLSSVYEILDYWIFPSFLCVVWLSTDVLSCTASILNLLCISVDRYLAISRPLHYHKFSTPKFIFIMIATAWIVSILISVAPVFGFEQPTESDQCQVAASGLFWTLYSSVGSFFLPLSAMLFLYYRIYMVAAKHSKFMKEERERFASFAQARDELNNGGRNFSLESSEPDAMLKHDHPRVSRVAMIPEEASGKDAQMFPKDSIVQAHTKKSGLMQKLRRLSREKKAAKTLFIVMACFIGCWFPFFTIYLIDGVCQHSCSVPKQVFKVFFWLGYCNSMLNPFIYAASSQEFRAAFRRILRCPTKQTLMEREARTAQQSTPRPAGNGLSSSGRISLRQRIPSHLINNTKKLPSCPLLQPDSQVPSPHKQEANYNGITVNHDNSIPLNTEKNLAPIKSATLCAINGLDNPVMQNADDNQPITANGQPDQEPHFVPGTEANQLLPADAKLDKGHLLVSGGENGATYCRQVRVSDVGISTDLCCASTETGVQTSISFTDLGVV